MVHGGIDGFSRLTVFLQCSSNNKSSTVLYAFRSGVQQYGLPQRIRSDRGGENVNFIVTMYVYIIIIIISYMPYYAYHISL